MPHYKHGTLAKIGDIVKGKGYNCRGPDGELKEIVGIVIEVRTNNSADGKDYAGACTLTVAYLEICGPDHPDQRKLGCGAVWVRPGLEYGDTVGFEKIGEQK